MLLQEEVHTLLKSLYRVEGAPTDIGPVLAMASSNVICALTMSVRFEHNDLRFQRFTDLIDEGFRLFGSLETINFLPVLRFIPWLQTTRRKLAKVRTRNCTARHDIKCEILDMKNTFRKAF
jgi:26-hydroxylase